MTRSTFTESIFEFDSPWDSPYQGEDPRWLFVCSAGILRSPSAARIAGQYNINARSCGSSTQALIPLSANLIVWAQKIIFMMNANYHEALATFEALDGHYVERINRKSVIWDIPDKYTYMQPELVEELNKRFKIALFID